MEDILQKGVDAIVTAPLGHLRHLAGRRRGAGQGPTGPISTEVASPAVIQVMQAAISATSMSPFVASDDVVDLDLVSFAIDVKEDSMGAHSVAVRGQRSVGQLDGSWPARILRQGLQRLADLLGGFFGEIQETLSSPSREEDSIGAHSSPLSRYTSSAGMPRPSSNSRSASRSSLT